MDRSFEGLLLSLAVHAVAIWLLWHAPKLEIPSRNETTEVTFIERDHSSVKSRQVVDETETRDVFQELKDQADYLSRITKRVQKQMKAREAGPTRNAKALNLSPTANPRDLGAEARKGIAGMTSDEPEKASGHGPRARRRDRGADCAISRSAPPAWPITSLASRRASSRP
ncbi:MAG: hypothetical protein HC902_07165 [Calothrix sp. SM1_5_4]|nr:hypothetical protein [Calothrix sp. SM1_5_4]